MAGPMCSRRGARNTLQSINGGAELRVETDNPVTKDSRQRDALLLVFVRKIGESLGSVAIVRQPSTLCLRDTSHHRVKRRIRGSQISLLRCSVLQVA